MKLGIYERDIVYIAYISRIFAMGGFIDKMHCVVS